jgi:hypothetical protein
MVPAWLLEKKPTGNDVLIYVTLGSHGTWNPGSGTYESCKPAVETMAEETGMSRSTIKRSLGNLLKLGALERTLQYTPEGDPAPSLYRVIFGSVVEPSGVGSQVDRPPKADKPARSKGGRSTGGPTSVHGRTEGRSTGEPRVGPPVDHNQDPLNQDPSTQISAPPSSVRLDDEISEDSSTDGQMTIDGETEAPPGPREPTVNDMAMGIARGWVAKRLDDKCPVVMTGKGADPVMALRKLLLPYLESGYTELEIKHALPWTDTGIPNQSLLESGLAAVRRGWRTPKGWCSGDGKGTGRPAGRQRTGNGPMAGTNLHIDDLSEAQRRHENPFAGASRQSDYAGETRGAVA